MRPEPSCFFSLAFFSSSRPASLKSPSPHYTTTVNAQVPLLLAMGGEGEKVFAVPGLDMIASAEGFEAGQDRIESML
jgi:hypothetical protein